MTPQTELWNKHGEDTHGTNKHTCVRCGELREFIERHFNMMPAPESVVCFEADELHRQLLPHSGKPCPGGCGLTVPHVYESCETFVRTWLRPHGHVDFINAVQTRHGASKGLLTNLMPKTCAATGRDPYKPRCRYCNTWLRGAFDSQ